MFKVGDVVVAKSGGPNMTVSYTDLDYEDEDQLVKCIWFDSNNTLNENFFNVGMLNLVK